MATSKKGGGSTKSNKSTPKPKNKGKLSMEKPKKPTTPTFGGSDI